MNGAIPVGNADWVRGEYDLGWATPSYPGFSPLGLKTDLDRGKWVIPRGIAAEGFNTVRRRAGLTMMANSRTPCHCVIESTYPLQVLDGPCTVSQNR